MRNNNYNLENGIYMDGEFTNFILRKDGIALTSPNCSVLSYIQGTLIVVKEYMYVSVYSPKIEYIDNLPQLVQITKFRRYSGNSYLKVVIGEKSYIIDHNAQITLCSCKKFY